MSIWHVSEQPNIELFEPRPPPSTDVKIAFPKAVWAVDDAHLPNYLLPRECPRVTFYARPDSTAQDCDRFLGLGGVRHVVAIESGWLERASGTTLWVYEFSPASFVCADATAGYFVSAVTVTPIASRRVDNPLLELVASGVELRVLPHLHELARAIAASSLAFSCIRMRNATAE